MKGVEDVASATQQDVKGTAHACASSVTQPAATPNTSLAMNFVAHDILHIATIAAIQASALVSNFVAAVFVPIQALQILLTRLEYLPEGRLCGHQWLRCGAPRWHRGEGVRQAILARRDLEVRLREEGAKRLALSVHHVVPGFAQSKAAGGAETPTTPDASLVPDGQAMCFLCPPTVSAGHTIHRILDCVAALFHVEKARQFLLRGLRRRLEENQRRHISEVDVCRCRRPRAPSAKGCRRYPEDQLDAHRGKPRRPEQDAGTREGGV
mmetsp:Transcript_115959/g.247823  ORF Transcript_115959/g.247823 Transcript_115959/m.247823 type:complete len:267 (+) Transcript_115959:1837-2637(+)